MNISAQDNNWNSLNKEQQLAEQQLYNQLFDSNDEDELLRSYEIEENYGKHNLKLRKLYTVLYDMCYAGGMALIAARNLSDARRVIIEDCGSWNIKTLQEVEDATIYTSFSHIIREGSYAE